MTEHFNNLLSCHHFFHKRLCLCNGYLLAEKIFGRPAGHGACREHHAHNAHYNQYGKYCTIIQHNAENNKQSNKRYCHLRQTLAYELTQSINVVGVIAHYIAVPVGIKILYGQILHMAEHFFTHFL